MIERIATGKSVEYKHQAGSEEQKREILVLTEPVKSFPREEKHGHIWQDI